MNLREELVELFYENNVRCDQTIEGLVDDVEDIINKFVTANEWIPATDRLPEVHLIRDIFKKPTKYMSEKVLVCVKSEECDGTHYFVGTDFMSGRNLENVDWMMCCGYGGSAVYHQEITHWMPLPVPPEGE